MLRPIKPKVKNESLKLATAPHTGPISNLSRLAQYNSKKAILAVNPRARFPIAIYK